MKKTAMLIATLVLANTGFANQAAESASKLKSLGSVFKAHETTTVAHPDTTKMVYAGEDVSSQLILAGHTISA